MKKKRFACVTAYKIKIDETPGNFAFKWKAQIFYPESRRKYFKCISDILYESKKNAFKSGCDTIKKLGIGIIEDHLPKEKRIN